MAKMTDTLYITSRAIEKALTCDKKNKSETIASKNSNNKKPNNKALKNNL